MRVRGPWRTLALPVLLTSLAVAACDDSPAGPEALGPGEISNLVGEGGLYNTDPQFRFVGPLSTGAPLPGPFNGNWATQVDICAIEDTSVEAELWECVSDGSGNPQYLRTFDASQVTVTSDRYEVQWKLDDPSAAAEVETTYRIRVTLGDHLLGFADVVIGSNMRDAKNLATSGQIPLNENRTLVIAYHMGSLGCEGDLDCGGATVTPEGRVVFTEDQQAVAYFPPGWYDSDTYGEAVQVTIIEKPYSDANTCLPNDGFFQFGTCYTYTTSPDVGEFLEWVTVAQCRDQEAQAHPLEDFMQLAAWDENEPIRVLPNAAAPEGLDCSAFSLASNGLLGTLRRMASAVFAPKLAYAVDLGLGGRIRAFSDIGWVVPLYAQKLAGDDQTGTAGTTLAVDPLVNTTRVHTHLDDGEVTGSALIQTGVDLVFTFIDPNGVTTSTVPVTTGPLGEASMPWTLTQTPGTHTLRVTGEIIEPVEFTAEATATGVGPFLTGSATVAGAGTPVEGITAGVNGWEHYATTDAQGFYSLDLSDSGSFDTENPDRQQIAAFGDGYGTQYRYLILQPDQDVQMDFLRGLSITSVDMGSVAVLFYPGQAQVTVSLTNDLQEPLSLVTLRSYVLENGTPRYLGTPQDVVCGAAEAGTVASGPCTTSYTIDLPGDLAADSGELYFVLESAGAAVDEERVSIVFSTPIG